MCFLQWRANSSQYLGQAYYDLSNDNCGWSWMEWWIAVRPWEKRVELSPSMPKKINSKQKTSKTTTWPKWTSLSQLNHICPMQRILYMQEKKFKSNYYEASFPRRQILSSKFILNRRNKGKGWKIRLWTCLFQLSVGWCEEHGSTPLFIHQKRNPIMLI